MNQVNEITISAADSFNAKPDNAKPDNAELQNARLISNLYSEAIVDEALSATLAYIERQMAAGLTLPYFAELDQQLWQQQPKALDIYITDAIEGRALNLESRGQDHATNILSYPSEMPASVIELMPTLPLGELIICHEVVAREAAEQHKTISQHISHLLVHGILHLFGFDHMLGQAEQDEMESYEIAILAHLALPNPYL
jgi:probable rRNA maturation factor